MRPSLTQETLSPRLKPGDLVLVDLFWNERTSRRSPDPSVPCRVTRERVGGYIRVEYRGESGLTREAVRPIEAVRLLEASNRSSSGSTAGARMRPSLSLDALRTPPKVQVACGGDEDHCRCQPYGTIEVHPGAADRCASCLGEGEVPQRFPINREVQPCTACRGTGFHLSSARCAECGCKTATGANHSEVCTECGAAYCCEHQGGGDGTEEFWACPACVVHWGKGVPA